MKRFRDYYGAPPMHLLAIVASFVIIGAAWVHWFHDRTHVANIVVWFVVGLVVIELIVIPLAGALDRTARGSAERAVGHPPRGAGWAYVRVPALLSGLLLLVFLPLIFKLGISVYNGYTGSAPSVYLVRWLLATAAMFICSALLYGGGSLMRRRHSPSSGSGGQMQEENALAPPEENAPASQHAPLSETTGASNDNGCAFPHPASDPPKTRGEHAISAIDHPH